MSNNNLLQATPRELVGKAVKAIEFIRSRTTDNAALIALDSVKQVIEVLGEADKWNDRERARLISLIQLHIAYEDEIIAVELDKHVEAVRAEYEQRYQQALVTQFFEQGRAG